MEKAELKNIFESPFNLEKWHSVMQSLFRVKTIRQQPKEIPLSPNELAYNAFELGDTTTADERVIGFYLVNLKSGVWIEVNRVSLRNLLRNVYNNDVDGALIVFQLGDKWRFSYVSQIREIDDEGNFVKTETEPKRYTYLMGKDEICRTAADRFHLLSGKPITLNDIKEAFSVEKLNKEFYNELSNWYFWALQNVKFPDDFEKDEEVRNATSVIRLITRLIFVWFLKQKKLIPEELFDEREIKYLLNFTDKTGSTYYKAILQNLFFATLNTEMGCDKRKFVNRQYGVQGFYRYERFFNDKERFLQLTQNIPFLNGGLFENLDKNVGEPGEKRIDCFSNKTTNEIRLSVPDYLFFAGTEHADLSRSYPDNNHGNVKIRGLIQLLKSYNFTIEENTPFEIEVALDPELLGKVFENLLASYNPETKTTARKQTGSFYTPREIVNYMVDESLIAFLKNQFLEENPGVKVLGKSQIEMFGNETRKGQLTFEQKINESRWIGKEPELDDNLRLLLDFNDEKNPFDEKDTVLIMKAIDTCTILDPACGSGAFPMGILQKLVLILQKLDKNNEYWRKIQEERAKAENEALINRIQKDKEYAEHISFEDIRKKLLKELDERLDEIRDSFDVNQNEPDYARKLFLVENCIYGVDIQPIAVQIAKLRFFISLIIDQKFDDNKPNRGILTLPNLETKFVAANTLIGINRTGGVIRINEVIDKEKELSGVRHKHFSARTPETKRKYREIDFRLREEIADLIATETKNNVEANRLILTKKQAEFELSKKAVAALKNEKEKKKYKTRLSALEQEIAKIKETIIAPDSIDKTARQLADWNPYDQNTSASFFDSEWMFGNTIGFDIVIGNPPYVQLQKNGGELAKQFEKLGYKTFERTGDIYSLFYEKGVELLRQKGHLIFITSNKWMRAGYGESTRKFFAENTNPVLLVDFAGQKIFDAATVDTNILLLSKEKNLKKTLACIVKESVLNNLSVFVRQYNTECNFSASESWVILSPIEQSIKAKIETIGTPLKDWDINIYRGILTGYNEAFIIDGRKKDELIAEDPNSAEIIRPILRGRDIKRYGFEFADLYLIATFPSLKIDIEQYPAVKQHLLSFGFERLKQTGEPGARKKTNNKWFETQDSINYWEDFSKQKILWAETMRIHKGDTKNFPRFGFEEEGKYITDKTCFFATGNHLKFIMIVLNSTLGRYLCSQYVSILDDGGYLMQKIYLEKIPIAPYSIKLEKLIENRHNDKTENEINDIVYQLYELSQDEIFFIETTKNQPLQR